MKKHLKLSMCIIVAFILVMFNSTVRGVESSTPIVGTNAYYEELMRQQDNAVYADLLLTESLFTAPDGSLIYPDTFGGKYIDGDTLVICLTKISDDICAPYINLLYDYEDYYRFSLVEYSYNELLDGCCVAVEQMSDAGLNVVEYSVRQRENKIYIGVEESDISSANALCNNIRVADNADGALRSELATLPIKIEAVDYPEPQTANLTGGSLTLYNTQTTERMSLGVCGTYDGYPAILTCGHEDQSFGDGIRLNNSSGAFLGSVVYHNYYDNATGDYEIIKITNPNYAITNTIADTYSISGTSSGLSEGTLLYKYGAVSNITYCMIEDTDITINHDETGYSISGMTRTRVLSGTSAKGDSGGPYFRLLGNSCYFCGIHSSQNGDPDSDLFVYYTPREKIAGSGFAVKTS